MIRRLFLYCMLGLAAAALPVRAQVLKEVSVLYSFWVMTEATDNALGSRTDEIYQGLYARIGTVRWKKASLQLQVPYARVGQTAADGTRYVRSGAADLEMTVDWKHRGLTLALSAGIPSGYAFAAAGRDHLWLGGASAYIKPVVRIGTWSKRLRTGSGLETRFRRYLEDGAVGKGGSEGGLKGYVIRQIRRAVAGFSVDFAWQHLAYLTTDPAGTEVYSDPSTSYDCNAGLFVSGSPFKRIRASAGIARSVYYRDTAPGFSAWTQLAYTLPEKRKK